MEFISKSVEETKKIAFDFASSLKSNPPEDGLQGKTGATVVGLYGELGSGKTTFMKYLAESFGITETIQSPTFVIMKKYKIVVSSQQSVVSEEKSSKNLTTNYCLLTTLIHIDAYRLEKEEEMLNLGWREILANPKNLICVEWPERIAGIMPKHFVVRFEHDKTGENQRKISFA